VPPPAPLPRWVLLLGVLCIAAVDARLCLRLLQALRRRRLLQQRLAELGDNLPAVVYEARVDEHGRLRLPFVAGDALQLFAVPAPVLQQQPARLLRAVLREDRRALLAALRRSACGTPLDTTFRAQGVHGVRTVAMRAWPRAGVRARSRPTPWCGYWMDDSLAQARRAGHDAQCRRAQFEARARDRLLQVLGQGMRGPLQELQQAVRSLHGSTLPGRARKAVDALQQATGMLEQIVAEVLEDPVDDAGALPLRVMPADLRPLLRQVQQLMEPVAGSKGLSLRLQIDPRVATVLCVDALRLRQVLLNLIGNALKFTHRGGVYVRVRVVADDAAHQRVRVQVLDSGIGIAPALQEAVFHPYRQGAAGTARHFGGTGLGLGICRGLVQRMGGRLSLHSRPGRGTRISVELPLARPIPPSPLAEVPQSPAQVLVADDHPAHRLLLQWWLQGMGLHVHVVADGLQALQAWRLGRFRLLVCDQQMPGLSGTALAERIRQGEAMLQLPRMAIIGMTADRAAMSTAAIDHVLDRSATAESLQAAILQVCPALLSAAAPAAAAPVTGVDDADADADAEREALAPQRLLQRFGSPERVRQLLQMLCSSLEDDLRRLQPTAPGACAGAGHEVAATLHRISGALGTIGLCALSQGLRELSTRPPPLPAADLREVTGRLQRLLDHLRQLGGPA